MLLVSAACLALAVVFGYLTVRPPSAPRRSLFWWKLKPVNPGCDEVLASIAVSEMRRRGRPAQLTVVRAGESAGSSCLWIGVGGVKQDLAARHAEAAAKAGGCSLGEAANPERFDQSMKWWFSQTEKADGKHVETVSHAEMSQQRSAFSERFSDHADAKLGAGDALVISLVPHRNGKECYARAATSSEDLAWSWADASSLTVATAGVTLVSLTAAAGGVGGLLLALPGFGVLPVVSADFGPAAVLGAAAFLFGAAALMSAFLRPRQAKSVASWWHLPLSLRAAKKTVAIPSGHLAGWVSGGSLTAVEAHEQVAPDSVTVQAGIRLGEDLSGRDCWLPDRDRQWGLFVLGDPGTGKTTLLLNALRGDVLARLGGAERSLIWIETKGEGAVRAAEVIQAAGWRPCVIRAAMPEGPRLELLDWNDPDRSASLLTDAMRYAFEADDIREQSAGILNAVFSSVIALPPAGVAELGFSHRPEIMRVAFWLLGGDSQNRSPERARKIFARHGGAEYARFADYLSPPRSKVDSMRMLEPPRNKVQSLLGCRGLFTGYERPWINFERLIGNHEVTVLDLSPIVGSGYTESTAARTAAMMMFSIWDAIKTSCDAWQSKGKSVAVYSDELCDIAGFGAPDLEVVRALADQGRSRGVLPVFATQRPNQIPPRTREAISSFGSHAYFRLKNLEVAEAASNDLRGAYTLDEVMSFGVGKCAARLSRDGVPQPAFVLCPDDL